MDQDGIEAFFGQLNVNAQEDIVAIHVASYCEAESMGEFKQAEFVKGCTTLGCDSIQTWKDCLKNRLYPELKDETKFAALYKYAFVFATERGFKNVEVETACALWELFLRDRCGFLKKWC